MSIYKGEDMIAGPTQQKFVRKPAWSRAIAVTVAQLNAGYTAPADGLLVGYVYTTQQATPTKIMVNGVAITIVYGSASDVSAGSFQTQVNQGDSVTVERSVTASNVTISFIPFEDSIIGDPITITPEYIRNLHDPDWSQAESITAAQLTAGWTATKRGLVIIPYLQTNTGITNFKHVYINGVVVGSAFGENTSTRTTGTHVPVNINDVLTIDNGLSVYSAKFVPYKQQ